MLARYLKSEFINSDNLKNMVCPKDYFDDEFSEAEVEEDSDDEEEGLDDEDLEE